MSGFTDRFSIISARAETKPQEEEVAPPAWFGPPQDELGVVVPQSLVIARSTTGVVALRYVTAFSRGLLLDLTAGARGLKESRAQALFHDQHRVDAEEGLPVGFLRVGIEYPDGRQASNLAGHHGYWGTDSEPEGPVLFQGGGGGGSAGSGRVTMNPGYWLWPLPPAGTLRLFVEWPAAEIELSFVELAAEPLLEASSRSQPLWNEQS